MPKNKPTEEQEEQISKTFRDYLGDVIYYTNNMHKVLARYDGQLRGSHKKFLSQHALEIVVQRLTSLHNIAVGQLKEENEGEKPPVMDAPITVPERLIKKGVDPQAIRALRACVRSINHILDAITNATEYHVRVDSIIQPHMETITSRVIAETIRVIKIEQARLTPAATPIEAEAQAETMEAIEFHILKMMKEHDEKQYLAVAQRAIRS